MYKRLIIAALIAGIAGCTSMRDFAREHPAVTSIGTALVVGAIAISASDDGVGGNPDVHLPTTPNCSARPESCR